MLSCHRLCVFPLLSPVASSFSSSSFPSSKPSAALCLLHLVMFANWNLPIVNRQLSRQVDRCRHTRCSTLCTVQRQFHSLGAFYSQKVWALSKCVWVCVLETHTSPPPPLLPIAAILFHFQSLFLPSTYIWHWTILLMLIKTLSLWVLITACEVQSTVFSGWQCLTQPELFLFFSP